MKPFAIALVFFVFLAAFAGYWVLATDHTTTKAPTPVFTYSETGTFSYVASLKNNTLYNSTNLTPGNGTLFSQITTWINLTFQFQLHSNRLINASSIVTLNVDLQSPAWSKPLGTATASTSVAQGNFATVGVSFDLNVTNVTELEGAIGKQTGYVPSSYEVVLAPSVRSSLGLNENATEATFAPTLTLNFTSSQIVPSRMTASGAGAFVPPGDPATTSPASPSVVAFLLLFGAIGGVGAMGYLLYDARGDPRPAPDLTAITRPYQEAIVEAKAPPTATTVVPVRAWEDIVKAADTLGAPILRVARPSVEGPNTAASTSFYVLSGTTAFVFAHGPGSPAGVPPPPPVVPKSDTAPPPKEVTPTVRAWQQKYPRIPGADPTNLDDFVAWSDRISDRLRWFRPTSQLRTDSEELLLRSIGLAQRGRLDAAWVILGQLYARLGPWETVGRPPAAPAPRVSATAPGKASAATPASKGPGPKP